MQARQRQDNRYDTVPTTNEISPVRAGLRASDPTAALLVFQVRVWDTAS